MRFSDVIGHERVVRWLAQAVAGGRAGGAYLFYGPEGAGKGTLASAFVAALACRRRTPQGEACGACESCQAMARGRHPDLLWVEPSSDAGNVTIDQVRELRFWLGLSAGSPWGKAAVIDQADRMTLQAANALLKTLEEPSGPAVIVLLARELSAIPDTIQSRCFRFYVGPVPVGRLAEALQARLGLTPEQAKGRAMLAGGLPGRALGQAESVASQREAAMGWVEQALGASPQELLRLSRSAEQADGREVDERLAAMIWLWRDVAAWRWTKRPDLLVNVELAARLTTVGDRVDPGRAVQALETLMAARRMMAEYASRRLVLHWAWMTMRSARSSRAMPSPAAHRAARSG